VKLQGLHKFNNWGGISADVIGENMKRWKRKKKPGKCEGKRRKV
jgi:hypothetical protein